MKHKNLFFIFFIAGLIFPVELKADISSLVTLPYGTTGQVQISSGHRFFGVQSFHYEVSSNTLYVNKIISDVSLSTGISGAGGAGSLRFESGGSFIVSAGTMNFTSDQFTISNDGGEALIALNASSVTLQGQNVLTLSSAIATYFPISSSTTLLSNSSATATYLQLSSATATYLSQSSASLTYLNTNDASVTKLGSSITLGSETDGIYTSSLTVNSPISLSGTNNVESGSPILSLSQNAGTDVTADLEEEAHASEHQDGGADELNVNGMSGLLADTQEITVATNSFTVGRSTGLNLIEGSNITLSATESGNTINVTITGVAGGGGSNLEVFSNFDGLRSSPTSSIGLGDSLTGSISGSSITIRVDFSTIPSRSDVVLNQNTLQSGATAYPAYLVVGSSTTLIGQFTLRSPFVDTGMSMTLDPDSTVLILNQKSVGTLSAALGFTYLGNDDGTNGTALIGHKSDGHFVIAVSTGGTVSSPSVVDVLTRIALADESSSSADIQLNPSNRGFTLHESSITFDGTGTDPTLDWKTSGTIAIQSTVSASGVSASTGLFTSIFQLPNGASPAVNVVGQVALDTTDASLVLHDGQKAQVVAHATHTHTIVISSGTGWNGLSIPVFDAPLNMVVTIDNIRAVTLPTNTTVQYQLDERTFTGTNTSGTNVFSVTFSTGHNTGVETTSFSNSSIAAGSGLVFTTPSSGASAGTPSAIKVTIFYRKELE